MEDLGGEGLMQYAEICGELLARGHARSGDPVALDGYIGNSDRFVEAVSDFAVDYADQTDARLQDVPAFAICTAGCPWKSAGEGRSQAAQSLSRRP